MNSSTRQAASNNVPAHLVLAFPCITTRSGWCSVVQPRQATVKKTRFLSVDCWLLTHNASRSSTVCCFNNGMAFQSAVALDNVRLHSSTLPSFVCSAFPDFALPFFPCESVHPLENMSFRYHPFVGACPAPYSIVVSSKANSCYFRSSSSLLSSAFRYTRAPIFS